MLSVIAQSHDPQVLDQDETLVASYELLTMVAA